MQKIGVIGGGPAGMMAAYRAAFHGNKVTLFEKNKQLGKKLLITGNGRCNVTNNCDMDSFLRHVNSNSKFLYRALSSFSSQDMMKLLLQNQCPVKEEDNGRIFPTSDASITVLEAMASLLYKNGVDIHCNETVISLMIEDNICKGLITEKDTYTFDTVIICTGGLCYPTTGSTGDGFKWCKEAGIKITPLYPALTGLETSDIDTTALQGLSMHDVLIQCTAGKKKYKSRGDMIFTHYGISGPAVINLSNLMDRKQDWTIHIDALPDTDASKFEKMMLEKFQETPNRKISGILTAFLPKRLSASLLKKCNINPDTPAHSITKENRKALVETAKNISFSITGYRGFNEAMITQGGVDIRQVNPATMELKSIRGLKAAGELLDVNAQTGGYNLQIAWSTGYLAGDTISSQSNE